MLALLHLYGQQSCLLAFIASPSIKAHLNALCNFVRDMQVYEACTQLWSHADHHHGIYAIMMMCTYMHIHHDTVSVALHCHIAPCKRGWRRVLSSKGAASTPARKIGVECCVAQSLDTTPP